MRMDELKEIVKMIEEAKIDVLKLEKGDFKLYYQKNGVQGIQSNESEYIEETDVIKSSEQMPSALQNEVEETNETDEHSEKNVYHITSPIVGAFYARPNPNSGPFVQIGSKINKGDTVCVLEAMKLLNEVKSDVDGEIIDILAKDEDIIEYGQPLFIVKLNK